MLIVRSGKPGGHRASRGRVRSAESVFRLESNRRTDSADPRFPYSARAARQAQAQVFQAGRQEGIPEGAMQSAAAPIFEELVQGGDALAFPGVEGADLRRGGVGDRAPPPQPRQLRVVADDDLAVAAGHIHIMAAFGGTPDAGQREQMRQFNERAAADNGPAGPGGVIEGDFTVVREPEDKQGRGG